MKETRNIIFANCRLGLVLASAVPSPEWRFCERPWFLLTHCRSAASWACSDQTWQIGQSRSRRRTRIRFSLRFPEIWIKYVNYNFIQNLFKCVNQEIPKLGICVLRQDTNEKLKRDSNPFFARIVIKKWQISFLQYLDKKIQIWDTNTDRNHSKIGFASS